jgi:hypothetical protein
MRKILGTIASLLVALLLVAAPASADEYDPPVPLATPAGYTGPAIYGLWPTPTDVTTIPVYSRADQRWGVARIVRQWNEATSVLQLVLTTEPCQGCITISQSRDRAMFRYESGTVGGFADYTATGGVMQQCDIWMNMNRFFPFWPDRRRSLIAHEIGHCLGLGHTTLSDTVMGPSIRYGPTWLDRRWLAQLYGPAA